MRYRDMHRLAHSECHDCSPSPWHRVPRVTGDYDLDATIGHSTNSDMPKRLSMYVGRTGAYGPRTAYDAYGAAGGDD